MGMPPLTSNNSLLHPPIDQSPSVLANDIDNNDSETSPETAAVARGAAASARHSVRTTASTAATSMTKGSVGRLPLNAPNASKLPSVPSRMAKPPLAKSLPRGGGAGRPTPAGRAGNASSMKVSGPPRANQTIAKATDRFSTGLDVWNAATGGDEIEDGLRDSNQRRSRLRSLLPSFGQVTAFTRIFVTNTVLGMAVFATYEGMVEYFSPLDDGEILDKHSSKNAERKNGEQQQNKQSTNQFDDNYATINTTNGIEQNTTIEVGSDAAAQKVTPLTDNPKSFSSNEGGISDRVPIPMHFLAGGLGGASHAVLSLVLETKVNIANQSGSLYTNALQDKTKSTLISMPKPLSSLISSLRYPNLSSNKVASLSLKYPVMNYSIATIAHHSIAHAVLFGSYQRIKRSLSECETLFYSHPIGAFGADETSSGILSSSFNDNRDLIAHAAVIAFAGGIAGQAQHLTSHFTEQWFSLTTTLVPEQKSLSKVSVQVRKRILTSSWPAWRSTVLAFPPSAVGFLAFEYGKSMV